MNPHSSTPTPYPLTETAIGYTFTTVLGEQYIIYYSPGDGYFPGLDVRKYALMFGFKRVVPDGEDMDENTPSEDPAVKSTVVEEIKRYLEVDKRVLVYVCQDGKKQRAAPRHRLFGRWFLEIDDPRLIRVVVHESKGLYASFVYSKNSPFSSELEANLPTLDEKINLILE